MPKTEYLQAGQIVGTHGVRGEVRVDAWCDSPAVFAKLKTLYTDAVGGGKLAVKSRAHGRVALCKIDGVDTVETAAALRGTVLYMHRDDLKLPKGTHFISDLIDMRVLDAATGEEYGTITEVSQTGSNDVYHLKTPDGKLVLIPAIPAIVKSIDIDAGEMTIDPMKGLFDDDAV